MINQRKRRPTATPEKIKKNKNYNNWLGLRKKRDDSKLIKEKHD
jgi:hypothetical protein